MGNILINMLYGHCGMILCWGFAGVCYEVFLVKPGNPENLGVEFPLSINPQGVFRNSSSSLRSLNGELLTCGAWEYYYLRDKRLLSVPSFHQCDDDDDDELSSTAGRGCNPTSYVDHVYTLRQTHRYTHACLTHRDKLQTIEFFWRYQLLW